MTDNISTRAQLLSTCLLLSVVWAAFTVFHTEAAPAAALTTASDGDAHDQNVPEGLFVCEYEETRNESKMVKIDNMIKWTMDETGNRLSKPVTLNKPRYELRTNVTVVKVRRCCVGYSHTDDNTCQVCPTGSYGKDCTKFCGKCHNEGEICDHVIGCCRPDNKTCGVSGLPNITASPVLYPGNAGSIGFSVLALFTVCGLLFALVFYYRRKYQKERDPSFPVVSFHPDKANRATPGDALRFDGSSSSDSQLAFGSSQSSADGEVIRGPPTRTQFTNPLYGDPIVARTLERKQKPEISIKPDVGVSVGKGSPPPPYSANRPQNEYASLDMAGEKDFRFTDDSTESPYAELGESLRRSSTAAACKPEANGGGGGSMAASPKPALQKKQSTTEYDRLFVEADDDENRYEIPVQSPRISAEGTNTASPSPIAGGTMSNQPAAQQHLQQQNAGPSGRAQENHYL